MVSVAHMILKNLQTILKNIEKTGVKTSSIKIVGVTKFQAEQKIQEAIEAGVTDLGVNYAQDGEKLLPHFNSNWHFIGHIQSRKLKFLPDYSLVQSFDRLELAATLDTLAKGKSKVLDLLIEVNVAGEVSKSGVPPAAVPEFLEKMKGYQNLRVKGLMSMPPLEDSNEQARLYFKQMRRLYEQHATKYALEFLSMGTSQDYLAAIEEGANMVRLGTCLFGERPS